MFSITVTMRHSYFVLVGGQDLPMERETFLGVVFFWKPTFRHSCDSSAKCVDCCVYGYHLFLFKTQSAISPALLSSFFPVSLNILLMG